MTSHGTGSVIVMRLPYQEPLVPAEPGERVIPEPPRRGEPGGEPCRICADATTPAVWSDDLWTLHPPVGGSLAGAVWLASREHVDSFADLPQAAAEDFGMVAARVERAILALGGIARVHLNRWGDGGAHFHVWFIPRPLGMLEAQGMMLPLWEDVLPNVPDEQLRAAAERVAAMMDAGPPAPQRSSAPVTSQRPPAAAGSGPA
jgi:diadenosine tetraphosphate (Ap4A) HIT family hydrolase